MGHNSQSVAVHHEGDSHNLRVTVTDSKDNVQDLTGSTVKWVLLDSLRDPDTDAILKKEGTEGSNPSSMTFNDPANGVVTIHIDTGDTDGLVDWSSYSGTSKSFKQRMRITDSSGDRSTAFTGSFTVYP